MKKKLIEISIDENGKFLFETNSDCLGVEDFKLSMSESEFLKKLDPLVESLFVEYFKNKNEGLSRIVKLLTVADICADAQPYNNIEELWHVMMHIHLPKYEKKYRRMKESYGFKVKVDEPVRWINPAFADLFGKMKS